MRMLTAWERLNRPLGPIARTLRRASQSALGTYAAYLAHGLRHPALLQTGAFPEERCEPMPGDALVDKPDWVSDFAVEIAATSAEVWPWLVQIGYGRAGWYTWFPLDNNGRPSADAIIPALQHLAVGDIIPDGPRAAEGFGVWRVVALDPPHAMVLESRRNPVTGREMTSGSYLHVTWVFALLDHPSGACRLRVRVRARFVGTQWKKPLAKAARMVFGLGDNVMERTMIEGIRDRAELAAQGE